MLFNKQTDVEIPNSYIITPSAANDIKRCKPNEFDRCVHVQIPRSAALDVMMDSNFSLALRGDDEGGDRFQNALAAKAILVAVIENFQRDVEWLPFPDLIPWKDIVITFQRSQFQETPAQLVNSLSQIPEQELIKRRQLMDKYAPAVDVAYGGGFTYIEYIMRTALATPCGKKK